MGTERSLLGAVNLHRVKNGAKKGNSVPGSWEEAFNDWNWKKRAEAWDIAELERIKQEDQKDADEWRVNRLKDAKAFRAKSLELLRLPTTTRTAMQEEMIDGKLVTVAYTVEAASPATLRAAVGIYKTADELARITTRETLPPVGQNIKLLDWREEAKKTGLDPTELDELRERLTKEIYNKMMEEEKGNQ